MQHCFRCCKLLFICGSHIRFFNSGTIQEIFGCKSYHIICTETSFWTENKNKHRVMYRVLGTGWEFCIWSCEFVWSGFLLENRIQIFIKIFSSSPQAQVIFVQKLYFVKQALARTCSNPWYLSKTNADIKNRPLSLF